MRSSSPSKQKRVLSCLSLTFYKSSLERAYTLSQYANQKSLFTIVCFFLFIFYALLVLLQLTDSAPFIPLLFRAIQVLLILLVWALGNHYINLTSILLCINSTFFALATMEISFTYSSYYNSNSSTSVFYAQGLVHASSLMLISFILNKWYY
jgi:hypothetical protein